MFWLYEPSLEGSKPICFACLSLAYDNDAPQPSPYQDWFQHTPPQLCYGGYREKVTFVANLNAASTYPWKTKQKIRFIVMDVLC